jgi:hypothetical protein
MIELLGQDTVHGNPADDRPMTVRKKLKEQNLFFIQDTRRMVVAVIA